MQNNLFYYIEEVSKMIIEREKQVLDLHDKQTEHPTYNYNKKADKIVSIILEEKKAIEAASLLKEKLKMASVLNNEDRQTYNNLTIWGLAKNYVLRSHKISLR
jgi:hypothetical protein